MGCEYERHECSRYTLILKTWEDWMSRINSLVDLRASCIRILELFTQKVTTESVSQKSMMSNPPTMKRLWQVFILLHAVFFVSALAESVMPSIYCGASHSYQCTPEQALAYQRRQMQQRQADTRLDAQQSMARWFELQQRQKMQMERDALLVQPAR